MLGIYTGKDAPWERSEPLVLKPTGRESIPCADVHQYLCEMSWLWTMPFRFHTASKAGRKRIGVVKVTVRVCSVYGHYSILYGERGGRSLSGFI